MKEQSLFQCDRLFIKANNPSLRRNMVQPEYYKISPSASSGQNGDDDLTHKKFRIRLYTPHTGGCCTTGLLVCIINLQNIVKYSLFFENSDIVVR